MASNNLEILADSLIDTSHKRIIKLPPILNNKKNLLEVLDFFINYYSKDRSVTLKNASSLEFSKVSVSKIHLWMQNLALSIRISFLSSEGADDLKKIEKAYYFFNKNVPKCPLILRSALKKYKYITIDNWNKEQFQYCCIKEISSLKYGKELPSYLLKDFYNISKHEEVTNVIKELINISESLDVQGKYDLSEKLLNSTEKLSEKLGYTAHEE